MFKVLCQGKVRQVLINHIIRFSASVRRCQNEGQLTLDLLTPAHAASHTAVGCVSLTRLDSP